MELNLRALSFWLTVAVMPFAVALVQTNRANAAEAAAEPGPALTSPAPVLPAQPKAELPQVEKTNAGKPTASEPAEMPIAETVDARSVQLEQIAQQADRQTRHGFELAGHGAYFAARAEFLGALRLVAEGLDAEQKTNTHSCDLVAALTAIKEAEDFLPRAGRLETDVNLPEIIANHATPLLKDNCKNANSLEAMRRYMTFAQEKLAAAEGKEVAGSMALHAMGKLYEAFSQKKNAIVVAADAKAVLYFQAALLVYPKNFMAANDLGVLLARSGRYADARSMIEHSLSLNPQSTGWQNLAVVYRQLGNPAMAQQASSYAMTLRQAEDARRRNLSATSNNSVQWTDSQSFARTSTNTPSTARSAPMPTVARSPVMSAPAPQTPANAYGPAPTPAAASRMWRQPSVYQR